MRAASLPLRQFTRSSDDIFELDRLYALDKEKKAVPSSSRPPTERPTIESTPLGSVRSSCLGENKTSPLPSSMSIRRYLDEETTPKLWSVSTSSDVPQRKPVITPPDWPKKPKILSSSPANPSKITDKASPPKDIHDISDDADDALDIASKILYPDDKHQTRTRLYESISKRLSPRTELRSILLLSIQLGEFYKETNGLALVCEEPAFDIVFSSHCQDRYSFVAHDIAKIYVYLPSLP